MPWYQGIEFITALRRLGKEGYMFNYNGELHGLRNRDNQKHWTVHMDEFFDHYLLGKPRPEWMDKGVPFLERGQRDVAPMFKKKGAPDNDADGGGEQVDNSKLQTPNTKGNRSRVGSQQFGVWMFWN